MALSILVVESAELFLNPGEPRGFAFPIPLGVQGTAFFSQAIPSRPSGTKQSLWTIAHGIQTQGVSGVHNEFHGQIIHWVTVQVADPPVSTAFKIQTVLLSGV